MSPSDSCDAFAGCGPSSYRASCNSRQSTPVFEAHAERLLCRLCLPYREQQGPHVIESLTTLLVVLCLEGPQRISLGSASVSVTFTRELTQGCSAVAART